MDQQVTRSWTKMYSSAIYLWHHIIMAVLILTSAASRTSYKAAVFEHAVILPPYTTDPVSRQTALHNMNLNLDIFRLQAAEARRLGADILILPENGLFGGNFTRQVIYPYLEYIPDPEDIDAVPCNDPDSAPGAEVQHALSCMAKNNAIYLVASMGDKQPCDPDLVKVCPRDRHFQYNTAVAYGPDGTLLARYHKANLYKEYQFDYPVPKVSFFDTPFGRFGLLVCYDLMFSEPLIPMLIRHKITDIAFPTAWMDSLPLLSAIGYHSSVARGFNVNLLSANLHLPLTGCQGSGIFTPDGMASFYYNNTPDSPSRLIVSDVKIIGSLTKEGCADPPDCNLDLDDNPEEYPIEINAKERLNITKLLDHPGEFDQMFKERQQKVSALESVKRSSESLYLQPKQLEDLIKKVDSFENKGYTFIPLAEDSSTARVCRQQVCCQLTYSMISAVNVTEMFVLGAFDGLYNDKYYFQVCTVLKCPSPDKSTCGSSAFNATSWFNVLKLTGQFKTRFIYPQLVLSRNGQLELAEARQWSFRNNSLNLSRNVTTPVVVAALLGRVYDQDSKLIRATSIGGCQGMHPSIKLVHILVLLILEAAIGGLNVLYLDNV